MRCLVFAKRCMKEIIRDPLSIVFGLGLPIIMLVFFKILTDGMPAESVKQVPQFQLARLVPSIALFSYSFISLFLGMVVSKDRQTAFQARLRTSPMTSKDFSFGYILPVLILAVFQTIVTYVLGICLGLFNNNDVSFGTMLLSMACSLPIALVFISLGLLFGSLVSDQAVGGVFAIIVNATVLLGGIFMPLESLNKGIKTVAYIFPFAHSTKLSSAAMIGNYSDMLIPLLVVLGYTAVFLTLGVLVFKKKMNSDK